MLLVDNLLTRKPQKEKQEYISSSAGRESSVGVSLDSATPISCSGAACGGSGAQVDRTSLTFVSVDDSQTCSHEEGKSAERNLDPEDPLGGECLPDAKETNKTSTASMVRSSNSRNTVCTPFSIHWMILVPRMLTLTAHWSYQVFHMLK